MLLRDWLAQRPFTLALSSGFGGFFAHAGMIQALDEAGFRPARISGASSGALAGALWASGLTPEQIKTHLFNLHREDFWYPKLGLGLLCGDQLRHYLTSILPVTQIEDCKIPFVISVYNLLTRRTEVKTQGNLADWTFASAALPFLFQPIRLKGGLYADGGIQDRPAMVGLTQQEHVFYHHMAGRSPWRVKNDPALKLPFHHHMATLSVEGLTRLKLNELQTGHQAYEQAYNAMQKALGQPYQTRLSINSYAWAVSVL